MNKSDRRERLHRRRLNWQGPGRYSDYLGIENALTAEGFPEARESLDRNSLREDLRNCLRGR